MNTLKSRLKVRIEPCYLVEGDDRYLFDRALAMITKAMNLQLEDFNKSVFDDDNFAMQNALNSCECLPMGSDKRLVVIKNITKINENDKDLLKNYLKNPCLSTVLVILDANGKFASLKSSCEFVDAKRMDKTLVKNIVVSELAKNGKQISGEAVDTLIEYCNGYLTGIMSELDKLVFSSDSEMLVTKKMVENVVNKTSEFAVFELTEALGKRNLDKALKILSELEKDPSLLSLITNHFRRMFFVAISGSAASAELATLLNVKEYAILKVREQSKNYSKMQLKKIYALLEDVDYKIKSGQMLYQTALYYLVFSINFI